MLTGVNAGPLMTGNIPGMNTFFRVLLVLAGLVLMPWSGAAAAGDLVVSRAILEDPPGALSIADVVGREFTPVRTFPSMGYTDSVLWLRLQVRAPERGETVVLRIEPPYLDEIVLFEPDWRLPSAWKIRATGDRHAGSERDRPAMALGFVVNVAAPDTTFYLRLETTSSSRIYVSALEPRDAEHQDYGGLILDGLFIVAMLLLLLWGIQHNLADRQLVIGLFCLYQATYILYDLAVSGYFAVFFPRLPQAVDAATSVLVCGVTFAFLLFSRTLFRLYEPSPWSMRVLGLMLLAFPLEMAILFAGHARVALNTNAIVMLFGWVFLAVAALTFGRDQVPSRRFVQGVYIALGIFGVLSQLANLGLLTTENGSSTLLVPLLAHGLLCSLLLVTILNARLRRLRLDTQQALVDLSIAKKTVEVEHRLKEQAEELAHTDYLTGLYNRRYFVELAERELDRASRYKRALTMIMLDIDNFKVVNDTRGHSAGDVVLQEVARLIRDTVRSVDIVGRIGGEEFAVVLVEMDESQALEAAERVRRAVEQASIAVHEGVPIQVTISVGLSHLEGRDANFDTLLSEADRAMYAAKESGRNRVMVDRRM